jgi:hypothetical protein
MPNVSPQVLAQMLRSQAGSAPTQAEINSFLAAQPTPSMDYMRQTAGAAMTAPEMARMAQMPMIESSARTAPMPQINPQNSLGISPVAMPEINRQAGAALTPYELQQLQMMQGR